MYYKTNEGKRKNNEAEEWEWGMTCKFKYNICILNVLLTPLPQDGWGGELNNENKKNKTIKQKSIIKTEETKR